MLRFHQKILLSSQRSLALRRGGAAINGVNLLAVSSFAKHNGLCAPSTRTISFFNKENTYVDLAKKKIRKSNPSAVVVAVLFALSWVFIFKMWFNAEEEVQIRAQKYYAEGNSMDNPLPEEYRSEFVSFI
jgi:hypothetical protein